ncbi:hypothetical protein EON67_07195, partial [archaeon]
MQIVQCEIDRRVVEVSKQFFGSTMATSFEDPRVTLLFDDAAKYIADKKNEFDVIIVDSSDPNEGPATSLFTPEFYKNLSEALKEGGIVCTQGECMWQNMKLITEVLNKAKAYFPVVDYAYTCVPTYPSGQIGFLVCSKSGCRTFALHPSLSSFTCVCVCVCVSTVGACRVHLSLCSPSPSPPRLCAAVYA